MTCPSNVRKYVKHKKPKGYDLSVDCFCEELKQGLFIYDEFYSTYDFIVKIYSYTYIFGVN